MGWVGAQAMCWAWGLVGRGGGAWPLLFGVVRSSSGKGTALVMSEDIPVTECTATECSECTEMKSVL